MLQIRDPDSRTPADRPCHAGWHSGRRWRSWHAGALLAVAALLAASSAGAVQSHQGGASGTTGFNSASIKSFPSALTTTYTVSGGNLQTVGNNVPLTTLGGATAAMFTPNLPTTTTSIQVQLSGAACSFASNSAMTASCPNVGTLQVGFSRPVTNPVLHFVGLGSARSLTGDTVTITSGRATHAIAASVPAGATLTVLPGAVNLQTIAGGTGLDLVNTTTNGTNCSAVVAPATQNAGCGSVRINGTVTSVTFNVSVSGNRNVYNATIGNNLGDDGYLITATVDEDFGDAPASLDAVEAASHIIGGLRLGASVDADNSTQFNGSPAVTPSPNAVAAAADNNGSAGDGADENGLAIPLPALHIGLVGQAYSMVPSLSGSTAAGTVCGWIDFDRDGSFETSEGVCRAAANGATSINLDWTVPPSISSGRTYVRLRASQGTQLTTATATGRVDSGEVEDYTLGIGASDPCTDYAFPYTLTGGSDAARLANLRQAIQCANGNGAGADAIDLGGQTVVLPAATPFANYDGQTALPQITSVVSIRNGRLFHDLSMGGFLFRTFSIAASGTLNLQNMDLSGDSAPSPGGAFHNSGTLNVTNSRLHGYATSNRAGVLHNASGATATITNSLFYDNNAVYAHAIDNAGTVTIVNSTFDKHTSVGQFGFVLEGTGYVVRNSIFWNPGNTPSQIAPGNSVSDSLVRGGYGGGSGILASSPLFVDEAGNDFRLAATSPAINVGVNANVPLDDSDVDGDGNLTETRPDLDLNPRIVGGVVDLGAHENQGAAGVPVLSINDVSLNEGLAGTTSFTFTVSLSAPAPAGGVAFDIATADGTAQDDVPSSEDSDYQPKSLTSQTIPSGSSTYSFTVLGYGDLKVEPNETFFINVSNVNGATVGDGQGQGTITNDDSATLTIANTSQSEGGTFTFTAVLSAATSTPFSVDWTFAQGTTVAADYVGGVLPTGGTLNFTGTSGETRTFTVPVFDDTLVESSETFTVGMANFNTAGSFTVNTSDTALGTITDNDVAADFTVTTTATSIAVTDSSGNGATLAASEPAANTLRFDAAGRTFSVNGAALINGNSGSLSLSGITSITITAAGGTSVAAGTFFNIGGSTLTSASPITLAGGTLEATGTTAVVNAPIVLAANSDLAGNMTLAGAISGDFTLRTFGAGTYRFGSTASTFSRLQMASGTVALAGNNTLPPQIDIFNSATFNLNGFSQTIDFYAGAGPTENTGAAASLTLGVAGSSSSFGGPNYLGPISGPINLTLAAGGSQTLGSAISNYTGSTDLPGALRITGTSALGAIGAGNGTTVAATGSIDLSNVAYATSEALSVNGGTLRTSIGSSSFPGPIALTGSAATINVAGSQLSLDGVVSGSQGFSKTGNGFLRLTQSNSYTGPVAINSGTLLVTGTTAAASSITVNNTGTLGGTGTVNGPVSVASGGTLSPGVGVGVLNTANVSFASGATFAADLTGATAGTQYDQLDVNGSVNLGGATLALVGSFVPTTGQSFLLIDNDGSDVVTGSFAGLPQGSLVTFNGVTLAISYNGGDGNDVTLTAVVILPTASVVSLDRASGNPRNTPTVTWQVTFSTPINGLSAANFAVVPSGLGGTPTVTGIAAAGSQPATQWSITVSTGTGSGTLGLNLVNDNGLSHDLTNLPFTGQLFTIDRIPPTVTITVADTTLTVGETSPVSFVFSEVVNQVLVANMTVANGTVSTPTTADFITWNALLTPSTGVNDATNVVTLDMTGSVDLANNPGVGSTPSNNYAINTVLPVISINDVSAAEGNSATSTATFTVSLDQPAPSGGVSFTIATANGTAMAGSDYVARSLTGQTIPAGQSTYSFAVTVNGDTAVEANETYVVSIGSVTGATVGDAQGQGTIVNDDATAVTITDAAVTEGNSGTRLLQFSATLADAVAGGFTVNYATANGTASTADNDYVNASGTLTFTGTAGETQTISVIVNGDVKVEADENFTLSLNSVSRPDVSITDTAIGTLLNDDAAALTIADVTRSESGPFTFSVVLNQATGAAFSVDWSLAPGTTVGADYVGGVLPSGGTLTFAGTAGETRTLTVPVLDDSVVEASESFTVSLSNVTTAGGFAVNASDTAIGTILDDDLPAATIVVAPASVSEDGADDLVYTITLDQPPPSAINVNFAVGGTATAGIDYAAVTSPLSIAAGQSSATITVAPTADAVFEASETAILTLASGAGYRVGTPASATGTLVNDDLPPATVVSLDRASGNPRNTPTVTWSVTFSEPIDGLTPANFAAVPVGLGGTPQVLGVTEVGSLPATQWNISAGTGSGSGTLGLNMVNDSGLTHDLTNLPFTGQVFTIDRTPPTVTITVADTSLTVGETSPVTFVFSETVNQLLLANVTVENGALSTPTTIDFITWTATLTPTAGINDASNVITVDRSGSVDLANNPGVGSAVSNSYAINTLLPTLTVGDVTRNEGFNGVSGFDVTVTLSIPAPVGGVTFDIATADGTATAGSDYAARSFTSRTIAEGSTSYVLAVPVNGDAVAEVDETFFVNVSNVTGATVADGQGLGTIVNDDTAGITVTPTAGLVTTEAGGTATFTIVLNSQPTASVSIGLSSSDTTEGTAAPASVTFTTANWNVAQTVTVTGVDDLVVDGNVAYSIVTAAATSADSSYNGLNASDVAVSNTDNDTAGITVNPTAGLVTTEAGATAAFTVVLNSQPTASVSIGLSSSDTTEGTAAPASVTFTTANWNIAQTVTVTGVDDPIDDGNVAYTIVTAAATSADTNYSGVNAADVSVSNTDNDTAGITVNPTTDLVTTEAGGTSTFTVVLNTQPTSNVAIGLSSSDTTEGTVAPASVTFTTANWNVAQTVTVTGVDDPIEDGNVAYTIVTAAATSADTNYSGVNAADVSVSNTDNDTAGITVNPTTGLVTTEAGGTATFTVVLNTQPTGNVAIGLTSSDTTEGTVAPANVTFTTANWNIAQTVTVTGVDDPIDDGNVAYTIVTAAATSADTNYSGVNAADVSVSNTDNDTAGITVNPTTDLVTTEAGGTSTFTVVLNTQPTSNVAIGLSSSDTTEGTVAPASVTFTTANWNVAQTVTVTGVDDSVFDGDVAYTVTTAPANSADPNYSGIDAADIALGNTDNDAPPVLSVSNPSQTEGGAGSTTLDFVVSLSAISGRDVTFTRATADATATAANNDYVPLAAASATIPAGQLSITIPVLVNGDSVFEGDETFRLNLTAIDNATPTSLSGIGTIVDDDQQPTATTITSDTPDPSVVGQPYTVSVSVSAQTLSPLGSVTISDGTASCGPVSLTAGTLPASSAACALTTTTTGARTLTASYTPASSTFAASGGSATHQVNAAATTISVSGPASSPVNQPTTFSFLLSVVAPGGGTPSGTVTLTAGSANCHVTVPTATPACALSFGTLGPATISASYVPDDGDHLASASTAPGNASTLVFAPVDLQLTKTDGDAEARPGDTVPYTLGYRNAGSVSATGVVLNETVPTNTRFDQAASSPGWSCADNAPAGTACSLAVGTLAAGIATASATFAVQVDSPVPAGVALLTNSASISDDGSNGPDATPADNVAVEQTPVDSRVDLSVQKSTGVTAFVPGQPVVYQLAYRNQGSAAATGVVVIETVPDDTFFVAASSTPGWSCPNNAAAGTQCSFPVGTLAAGQQGSVAFAVALRPGREGGVIRNTVRIQDDGSNGADPAPENNASTVSLAAPALAPTAVPSSNLLGQLLLALALMMTAAATRKRQRR